jgi:hypothetical protein
LGLKSDGSIVAWGINGRGECNVPAPNSDFVAVFAGVGEYSLGLKSNGSVVGWGDNRFGICNVPAPNSDFVALATGSVHALGLKSDGSVVAWGVNALGQCDVPAPNADFIAVAAGEYHSLGLKSDGRIVAWGMNDYGQCEVPAPNAGFVAVAAGLSYSLGIKSDGRVEAWGWNYYRQCDVPTLNADFVAVDGGFNRSLGLKRSLPVPVLIASFEAERSEVGVLLRWRMAESTGLRGFNVYRSLDENTGFERVNDELIPADQGNVYVDRGMVTGETYWYRLGAVADDGEWMSQTVSITVPSAALALHQNVPNPFNPSTTISFTLPERARVTLAIYDVGGRLVRTLVDDMVAEGKQERVWDGKDASGSHVSSGVYFYSLTAGDKTLTKKMVLLK